MGFNSFAAASSLILVAACGGAEFSANSGESGGNAGQGEGGSQVAAGGASQGTSGGAGTMTGAGGAGGVVGGTVDASTTGGSGGHAVIDAGPRQDVSGGSGGAVVVDARADIGAPDSGPAPSCPVAEPTLLGNCNGTLKCTYGGHPRLSCRKTYTCSSGQWSLSPPMMCADLPTCQPPYPQVGFSCTATGSDCIWDTGLYCRCLACPDMGCPRWDCFPPPNGCTKTPPNLGQPCNPAAMPPTCEYGECSLGSRVTVTCVNGVVNWAFPNCQ